jgi:predicted acyltransferase (DUF342 family)
MDEREKGYYIDQERQYNKGQNEAELLRLREQASEMLHELRESDLSEAARLDLQEQLKLTNEAIRILRDSVVALSTDDIIVVDSDIGEICAEVTNPWMYWSNTYNIKSQEITDILEEIESYKGKILTDDMKVILGRLREDLKKVSLEADQAMENWLKLGQ